MSINNLQKKPNKAALMLEFEAAMISIFQHRPVRNSLCESTEYEHARDQDRFVGFCAARLQMSNQETTIIKLANALRTANNGLRHCARWNISEEKEKALMAVVLENENILGSIA